MRSLSRVHVLRLIAIGILGFLIEPGCSSDPKYQREAIVVHWIQFPDSVIATQIDSMTVLAQVGYVSCEIEGLEVSLAGDSLTIVGSARCRVDALPGPAAVRPPRIATPPVTPNVVLLRVPVPPLPAGTYRIVLRDPLAASPTRLADTLVVSPTAPVTRDARLVGFGSFSTRVDTTCAAFPVAYVPDAVIQFASSYLIEGLSAPPFLVRAGVLGSVLGQAACDSWFAGTIRLRRAIQLALPDALQ